MKIFPVYYFPPVSWFAAAIQEKKILLEQWEFYKKQQYFSRMTIQAPERVLRLSIPIRKATERTLLRDREIAYDSKWQHDQWKSLESAYRSSPYFEYYEDQIAPFFEGRPKSLFQHNMNILESLRSMLKLDLEWEMSDRFQGSDVYEDDFRMQFDAKREQFPPWFKPEEYGQVFGTTFSPDLSILDLLFNRGPEAVRILRDSFQAVARETRAK